MKTFLLLSLLVLAVSVSAAQDWEIAIGKGIQNLAGGNASNDLCSNIFYTGNSCGNFIIGITAFLALVFYCFVAGLSSEVTIPMSGMLLLFLANWGFLPVGIAVGAVFIAGLLLYKAISQTPNG